MRMGMGVDDVRSAIRLGESDVLAQPDDMEP